MFDADTIETIVMTTLNFEYIWNFNLLIFLLQQ